MEKTVQNREMELRYLKWTLRLDINTLTYTYNAERK